MISDWHYLITLLEMTQKTRKFVALFLGMMLYIGNGLNDSFWTSFLPTEMEKWSISESTVGLIASAYDIMGLITSLSLMLAQSGLRRVRFCAGSACVGIGCMALGQLVRLGPHNLSFVVMCILTRALMGMGSSVLWCMGSPYLISLFPDYTGRICSMFEASANFGIILGPPLGSVLFDWGGYTLPFWVVGIFQLSFALLCLLGSPPEKNPHMSEEVSCELLPKENVSALSFIMHPGVICVALAATLASSSLGFLNVAFAPLLEQNYQIGSAEAGYLFLPFTIGRAFSGPLFGVLIDWGYSGWVFCGCGSLLHALVFLVLGLSPFLCALFPLYGLQMLLLVAGTSTAAAELPTIVLFRNIYLKGKQVNSIVVDGYAAAVTNSCFALGLIIGQCLIGGIVYQHFGFYNSCLAEAVICGLTAVLGTVYLARCGLLNRLRDTCAYDVL